MIVGASSPRRAWRRREWRRREWRRREWRRHDGSAGRGGRYCLTTARPALASRWWSRASATPGGSLSRRLSRAGRALPRSTGRPDRTVPVPTPGPLTASVPSPVPRPQPRPSRRPRTSAASAVPLATIDAVSAPIFDVLLLQRAAGPAQSVSRRPMSRPKDCTCPGSSVRYVSKSRPWSPPAVTGPVAGTMLRVTVPPASARARCSHSSNILRASGRRSRGAECSPIMRPSRL